MKTTPFRFLILPVGFTFSLIVFRCIYSGSGMYLFFVWNLFLAAIPLSISSVLIQSDKKFHWLLFIAWLLFFPNALYIITDLLHLKERNNIPLWFDVILIFSAAINGLIMAYLSISQVEFFLKSKFSNIITKVILSTCLIVCAFGVYVGRYLRWNSWDILLDPYKLFSEMIQPFVHPFQHPRTWGMTIILSFFFNIFYFLIKKIPGPIMSRGNYYQKRL